MRKSTRFFYILVFCGSLLSTGTTAQKSSLILLGDLHYDRMEDHVVEYLEDKPGDLRQVMEYTEVTEKHWKDFMEKIRIRAESKDYPCTAVLQAGDLSEGLAGSEEMAAQMARHVMEAVESTSMPVPWILAKGNHDITGPGAEKAFWEFYLPVIRKQTGNQEICSANYSYETRDVQVVCLDPWEKETDLVEFLEHELSGSPARYKFILVHEPLIPVTERCWHLFREEPERREKLLEIIARNRGVILCGHLHRYSVVRRNTAFGPVVQVMVVSVVRDRSYLVPDEVISDYGASLAGDKPDWQPETLEIRSNMLSEEAKYVTHYRQCDLPGYARIKIDAENNLMEMEYYAAFGDEPYETIDLTSLMDP